MVENRGDSKILEHSPAAVTSRRREALEPHEALAHARQGKFAGADLVTRLSHEMRTPLSAILGFAQLLESGRHSLSDSQEKSLARILQAGWHLEKLIAMANDLALIDSGTFSLSLEPVPLAAVMHEGLAMIEPQAQMRGVHVTLPVFETPLLVSADRNRLPEVLGHLLSAAAEYGEGQGAVVVDCETHGAEWIRVNLRDAGAGSCVERLARCFLPFGDPAANSNRTNEPGIGVLLAQRLVELMGGTIGVRNNGGSRNGLFFDLKRIFVPMSVGHASASVLPNAAGQQFER